MQGGSRSISPPPPDGHALGGLLRTPRGPDVARRAGWEGAAEAEMLVLETIARIGVSIASLPDDQSDGAERVAQRLAERHPIGGLLLRPRTYRW
jgi:hypothetical protein